MKYTESVRYALGTRRVNEVFETAKLARTQSEKMHSKITLGHVINMERANYLKKRKGWSNAAIAEELGVTESFVAAHLITE